MGMSKGTPSKDHTQQPTGSLTDAPTVEARTGVLTDAATIGLSDDEQAELFRL
jgi:hypothetical protein